jgi:hypothetical protein
MFEKDEFKIKDICSTFAIRNNYKRHVLWHIIIRSRLIFLLKCLVKVNLKVKIFVRQRINYRLQYETILFVLECLAKVNLKLKIFARHLQ